MNNEKMFTIDLLKGQGVPVKSRVQNIAAAATTVGIPAIVAIILLGYYIHNSVVISIEKQRIANYETNINKLSDAVKLQKSYEKEKEVINGCLSEVATNINKHTQWTPLLVETVKNMPDAILLKGMNLKQDTVQKTVPSKNKDGGMTEITVPVRILQINVCESPGFVYGQSIRDFQDAIRASPLFSSRLDNINVSQEIDTFKGQNIVSYQVNCAFKPGL